MKKLIVFDIDGVITDGSLLFDVVNTQLKKIQFKDLDSFNEIKKLNIDTMILSSEENSMTEYIKNKFMPTFFFSGIAEKYDFLDNFVKNNNIDFENIIYVGDGKKDLACMKKVGFSICPRDAISDIKEISKVVLKSTGGNGVICEVYDIIRNNYCKNSNVGINDVKNNDFALMLNDYKTILDDLLDNKEFLNSVNYCVDLVWQTLQNNNKLLSCGNGGSACESQHLVSELIGRYNGERKSLPAIDLCSGESVITCIGNDYNFDLLFNRQIEALGEKNDLLFAFSTSGSSNNIINALKYAKINGLKTILLTSDKCSDIECDCLIKVPNKTTARIQEIHLMIIHYICEYIEKKMK